ncbi:MAG: DUF4382 domain-containing protein [Candidatus Hydrogenedentota bacterium]
MALFTCSLMLAACGGGGGGGTAADNRATIGISGSVLGTDFASDGGFVSRGVEGDVVPPGDIDSLVLHITKITMHHAGDDDEEVGPVEDHTDEEVEEGDGWIEVYNGTDEEGCTDGTHPEGCEEDSTLCGIYVDLMDLNGMTRIIDTLDIHGGKYTKMAIYYDHACIAVDGADPTDEVHITANGRMFVSQNFTLDAGGETLILIDFNVGDIHVTVNPSSDPLRYVLTPQLRAIVNLTSALVEDEGEITDLSQEGDPKWIQLDGARDVYPTEDASYIIVIDEFGATMSLDGEFMGLNEGQFVRVEGICEIDGSITADYIEVQYEEPEAS